MNTKELAGELLEKCEPWPSLPLPGVDEVAMMLRVPGGLKRVKDMLVARAQRIELEKDEPLRHGYVPPIWDLVDDLLCDGKEVRLDLERLYPVGEPWADPRVAGSEFERRLRERVPGDFVTTLGSREVFLSGGNRPGKSWCSARYMVHDQVENRGHEWWCGAATAEVSKDTQQKIVRHFFPKEWLNLRDKNGRYNTRFTEKDGFTDNKYVMPNLSFTLFKNYKQDKDTLEGKAIHGAWLDELVPLWWVQTIRARLSDHDGVLIVSFTPVNGYTQSVAEFRQGADELLSVPGVLVPEETGPKVERAKNGGHVVFFSPFLDNPYANHARIRKDMAGRPRKWVLMKTEGWVDKKVGVILSSFRRAAHVVRPEEIPAEGTNYMVVDPGKGKPWVAKWYRVTPGKRRRVYLYREWPCPTLYVPGQGYLGEWAVNGEKADGDAGPGQDSIAWGIDRYVREFTRLESGEPLVGVSPVGPERKWVKEVIQERIMDSRALSEATHRRGESNTCLGDELLDAGMDFTAASGLSVDDGVEVMLQWFDWDVNEPVSAENCPDFYVNEECTNSIFAYETWTNLDGQKGACKDFIDPDRYFFLSDPVWVDPTRRVVSGGKVW